LTIKRVGEQPTNKTAGNKSSQENLIIKDFKSDLLFAERFLISGNWAGMGIQILMVLQKALYSAITAFFA
jgi:hypothetical protein